MEPDANSFYLNQFHHAEAHAERKQEEAEAMRPDMVLRKFGELSDMDVLELIAGMADYTRFAEQLQRIARESKQRRGQVIAIYQAGQQIAEMLLAECDRQYGADLVEQAAHGAGEGKL